MSKLAFPALCAFLIAAPAVAQVAQMAGTWNGTYMGVALRLIVGPDGRFSEVERSPTVMTMQTGHLRSFQKGVVSFVVEDWEPRTMPVYHPTGTVGGYTTQQPTNKPPGGTYRITFQGANQFTMQDVNMGGVVTFHRGR